MTKCILCGNDEYTIPNEIFEAIKKENLVIFAGAGISTEGKNVFPNTLYKEVCDELKISNVSFPNAMSLYCNKPNGRKKLINKIIDRFDYYKSFSEIQNIMNMFYMPLANIPYIKDIITTNWDRQFEDICGCIPIMNDKDIAVIDNNRRKVYKIHGTIDNIGSIVATNEDYKKCYRELEKSIYGGYIKNLLSKNVVVFIGYSLNDYDFKKKWKYINKSLGEFKPHFYIVAPDINDDLLNKNITYINTTGANFIKRIEEKLINDKLLIDSQYLYAYANYMTDYVLKKHHETCELYKKAKNQVVMYSLYFQDGIIHSLKRILAKMNTGEYLDPSYFAECIESYKGILKNEFKDENYSDAAYVYGYLYAMIYFANDYTKYLEGNKKKHDKFCIYYLPRNEIFDNIAEYKKCLKKFNTKKYINYIKKVAIKLNSNNFELEPHHLPFL